MKKYLYSRKQIANKLGYYEFVKEGAVMHPLVKQFMDVIKDLLATKPSTASSEECEHIPDKDVGPNVWSCKKCRGFFVCPAPQKKIEKITEQTVQTEPVYGCIVRLHMKQCEIIDVINSMNK